ncbi:hypothetical protein LTR64_004530 [Lithohypha guttulata]|uniref:uncharacterized protein n=1 Tax=Lithohypha guttulata TaxID=1690604 RepID=UPI002DE02281|nr:hypothetical protein LTR51_006172 [Lithohypha guttulata]
MPASFYNIDNMSETPKESSTRPSYGHIRPNSFNATLKENPDILLDKMLRSGGIMIGETDDEGQQLTPQQALKQILDDPRWTRRMLEDWFKKGPPSRTRPVAFSPDPEFRALYLVILSKLEEQSKEKSTLDIATVPVEGPRTRAEEEAADRDLIRRTGEHFRKQQESRNLY